MIDRGSSAKIMDFGIARAVKGKSITGSGVVIGTPQYMSPEQVEGKEVDQRSDIYSLGIILYEMLTTRVPFEGDTPLTIGIKQKTEAPKDPRDYNDRIPEGLSRLILKCLEKERENRYRSADDLRADLDKLDQGLPTTDRVVPRKKPLTSRELTVYLNLKKLFLPAFVVIALAIVALVIWSLWKQKESAPTIQEKPFLAVLYFENYTGDENLDHWKRGLSENIITDFSQSKYIQVLSSDRLLSVLRKINKLDSTDYATEDLEAVAAETGVNYILLGGLSKSGETFRIEYRLHDIRREEISGSDRVEGQGENSLFPMVDELTLKVKKDFNLSEKQLEDDVDREVWRISTAKPEAYKYYIEAQQLENIGNYSKMIPILEKAVEIDPEFAMAYRLLGAINQNMGNSEKVELYLTKAYELRDRVPEIEKRWITADYMKLVEKDFEKAVDAYHRLFELAPQHPLGHLNLGGLYSRHGLMDKAIEHYEISRQNFQRFFPLSQWLGDAYEEKRMYEKARKVYQDYLDNIQDHAGIHGNIAGTYVYEGKYDLALQEADKAIALDPTSYSKAPIYQLMGDFEAAEKEYERWPELGAELNYWRYKEILYRTLGQYEKAKKMAQAGLKYAEENNRNDWKRIYSDALAGNDLTLGDLDSVLEKAEFIRQNAEESQSPGWIINVNWFKIEVYLRRDQVEKAVSIAEEVKAYVDSTPDSRDILYHFLDLGLIESKKQNYTEAIDLFSQAYELLDGQNNWIELHAWVLFKLAKAYELSGDIEPAKKEYENILALTTGRFWWGDLYAKSFYQLGIIHEQQGDTAKAIEHYEKFLSLWKDADSELPEVDDARQRLGKLKTN
jgi:tetratricopeptide (TPR) repeat protein